MTSAAKPVLTALLSVSDKTGIVDFARALHELQVRLVSTGGTARLLADAGLPVTEVADITGCPEMLDGRVKTLHPGVHGGLLARRDVPAHMSALVAHGIGTIDLLVVNLYPFASATARADCTLDAAFENIDIGGPAMLRAGAKNWPDVGVLVDPADYEPVLREMRQGDGISQSTRLMLAKKVFAHTAAYDGAVANYLTALPAGAEHARITAPSRAEYPDVMTLQLTKVQDLRYGENPHQTAAFYRDAVPAVGTLAQAMTQVQGKALSYNNIADADTAWECVRSFDDAACVIVKHGNPCGVAVLADGARLESAYRKALLTDPTSAFGGIVAFNRPLDGETAQAILQLFVEVVIAPLIDPQAMALFAAKPNVRLLEVPLSRETNRLDFKRVGGGLLVQSHDREQMATADLQVVTKSGPTAAQWHDLLFAWTVSQFVKSNAVVHCRDGMTLGIGMGQPSRIDSARIAVMKAKHAGLSLEASVAASDAFFPFRDGLDAIADAGAVAVIQPGGSVRDQEVIAAADERGIAMVFTGTRHFRH